MKKLLILFVAMFMGLVGCSNGEDADSDTATPSQDSVEETAVSMEDVNEADVVATIHDHEITGEDLVYEMKRLQLITLLQGEVKAPEEISPQVAIQEIVLNHMIHELASEFGIAVNTVEQQERAKTVRDDVLSIEGYETVMVGIDEHLFWSKEESRYETILEAEGLIALLMEEVKEEYPTYTEQALRFDAQEDLDELIQQQVVEAEVEINLVVE